MNKEEYAAIAERLKSDVAAIEAADTAENEARIMKLAEEHGMKVIRLKKNTAQRYKLKTSNSTLSPLTLLDIEGFFKKNGIIS